MGNTEVLAEIADPAFQTELGALQHRVQRPARGRCRVTPRSSSRTTCAASLNAAEERGEPARRAHRDDRHPADADARAPRARGLDERQRRATRRSTTRSSPRAARTSTSTSTGPGAAGDRTPTPSRPESACTSVQLHLQVAPQDFAGHWNAAQALAGPQLALGANSPYFFGRRAVARDPHRAVHAGHRHPPGRAEATRACGRGSGSASAGSPRSSTCSRRTSATSRRCCPSSTDEDPVAELEAGRAPAAARAAPAQRHGLPLEPAGLRHRRRPPAPAGGEPRAAGRPDRRRRRWPTPRSTTARCGCWPTTTGRSGRKMTLRRRPRRTSTRAPAAGIDATVYWPGLGEVTGRRAGAAPAAAAGPRGPGAAGAWTARSATATSGSSSSGASPAQRRDLAGGHRARAGGVGRWTG